MNAQELQQKLTAYTVSISGFEEKRNYISLSNIFLEPEELVRQYHEGFKANEVERLKCYKGYQMEIDLRVRIIELFRDTEIKIETEPEFSSDDGLFQCHPDLMINGIPADIKSVLKDEWLPSEYRTVSRKIKYQMQAQMMLSGANYSWVIYESRESGLIKVIQINRDATMCREISDKMETIRTLIKVNQAA